MNDNYISITAASYPTTRMRRNRQTDWSRRLIEENRFSVNDLILPIFITDGNQKTAIDSMPGVYRIPIDQIIEYVQEAKELGIPAIALFPETNASLKDDKGSEALNEENLVCRTTSLIKNNIKNIGIITDVALDPYTSHGHDGLLKNNEILNDESIEILCKQAIIQAKAGSDMIAPSDMMDGRIGLIRKELDKNGFKNTQIMSYAAKFASCFYGPFRNAIGSELNLSIKSKKSYQMDYHNSDEALREVSLDISEGADMIMIKPGMPYLDIIYRIKSTFKMPTYAYQVSGEFSMLMAAVNNKYLDKNKAIIESLSCFKRAGADGILSYFAIDAAKLIKQG
ncbi:MAG: porphobilinogen synthase [Pelagibacterales bacterium]|nr:porphobilinogen synthase [Pelagibacterales bacterium]